MRTGSMCGKPSIEPRSVEIGGSLTRLLNDVPWTGMVNSASHIHFGAGKLQILIATKCQVHKS